MIKTLNIILVCTSIAGLVGVYALKYSGEDTAAAKAAVERRIERQNGELSLLKADWAYLNQPAYIAPIIERHQAALGLLPVVQEQFGSMDTLPMRPPAPDRSQLNALLQSLNAGIDPAEQQNKAN